METSALHYRLRRELLQQQIIHLHRTRRLFLLGFSLGMAIGMALMILTTP